MHKTDVPYIDGNKVVVLLTQLYEELVRRYEHLGYVIDILVVGGSALGLKYNFRLTVDIDADIRFSHEIASSIKAVALRNNIPDDWINQDFCKSMSYSRRLWQNAVLYNLSYPPQNEFRIFVVNDLDQLCMKASSYRKKDYVDVKFLCNALAQNGYTFNDFLNEFNFLYGDSVVLKSAARREISGLLNKYRR